MAECDQQCTPMMDAALPFAGLKGKQKEKVKSGEGVAARPQLGRDKSETPSSLTDMLPDWMGYGFLYLVSIIPVLIVVTTIAILFFSSLK